MVAWSRTDAADRRVVVVNFTSASISLEGTATFGVASGLVVEVSSDGVGEGAVFSGRLEPDQALVLRPS